METALWNGFHCQDKVFTAGNRLYGKYCKNRFCTLCLANRKADLINKYLPIVNTWIQPYFVTLTVKAVPAKSLKNMITRGLLRGLNRIIEKYRKRFQRGKGIHLVGIRSLECNFNPIKRTYNPHFHLIVPNKEIADILVREWLQLWKSKHTHPAAQHSVKVHNLESSLIEIIKYGSKIFTEPDVNNKGKGEHRQVYARALYNILDAMKGHRLFDRFGLATAMQVHKPPHKEESQPQLISDAEIWEYSPSLLDWENIKNDSVLTEFEPDPLTILNLKDGINTELE